VKRLGAMLMMAGGLLGAGGANATPVQWTIPATPISGSPGNSISGTFVYDADTDTTSNINLSTIYNSLSYTLTVAGSNSGPYVRFVVANAVNQQGAYILSTNLTNAGGSVTLATGQIGIGPCSSLTSGLCDNINTSPPGGSSTSSVSISGSTPVPSLSEWAQLMLALMVLSMIGWHFHRERSY